MRRMLSKWTLPLCVALALVPAAALACPFCSGVSLTLSEEMKTATAAVVGKLVSLPPAPADGQPLTGADSKAVFEIVTVLKGEDLLKTADAPAVGRQIDVIYFGQDEPGKLFFLLGNDTPNVSWATPIPLTERSAEYAAKLPGLPETGADRLAFFQDYFEDTEELLARDAYDEFAKAPYIEVKQLKERMQHDKLVARIKDPNVSPSRRRLYLTMLGVCGSKDDLPLLEEIVKSQNPEQKSALDATIACYLTLNGVDGLPLIEELFLKKPDAEYTDTYAAIMALRFHGQEESQIPRERLVASLRLMLDRPELADLVIPDLARWQDWSAMDRLVQLFKEADEQSSWVRVPVIKYLKECPLPEAKAHIEELAKIDPKVVQQANSFFPLVGAPAPPAAAADPAATEPAATDTAATAPAAVTNPPAEGAASEAPADSTPPAETQAATDKPAETATEPAAAATAPEEASTAAASPAESSEAPAAEPAKPAEPASAAEASPAATAAVGTPPATGAIAAPAAERAVEIRENPWTTMFWVLAIPLAVGVVLMGLLLVILRGQRPSASA
ncbi:MAG: hypothetical protein JNG90_16955 [Planctomycetaceae bacterium]|nr:hypothetical protein [Planctomycetaceae bacterium]